MEITNNYQPNFKGVKYTSRLKKAILAGTLNQKTVLKQIENFKKHYDVSPVTAIVGLADGVGKRLDAQVFYGKPGTEMHDRTFAYMTEGFWKHTLGFSPKGFFNKVALKMESIEETYRIGRYAK